MQNKKLSDIILIRFAFSRRINFEAEDTGMVRVAEAKKKWKHFFGV